MKNKSIVILLSILSLVFATSCDNSDEDIYGNWRNPYTQFAGSKRASGAAFSIGEKFYYGMGYNSQKAHDEKFFNDMFVYDGSWSEVASFPGTGRKNAFSFSVGDKGYVGCGYNNDQADTYFDDVWEFTPPTAEGDSGSWRKLDAAFPGGARTGMVSFVIDGVAYIAGGQYDNSDTYSDCYKFDPTTGTFELVTPMGVKRAYAFAFVLDGIAYVGGGDDMSAVFEYYNPTTDKWNGELDASGETVFLRRLSLSSDDVDDIDHYDNAIDLRRYSTATFVYEGKGYIVAGHNGSVLRDCWVYDPLTDLWTEKTDFEYDMSSRYESAAFMWQGTPYIVAGFTGGSFLDDVWYFQPDVDEVDND